MKKFAFLIHPRDISDVARRFWITKYLPYKLVDETIKRLSGRIGFTICSKFRVEKLNKKAEGYIIAVLLTGKQIMTLPREQVRRRILDAILFAQDKLGVELIGLGALIPSVTHGGEWVIKQPKIKLNITRGGAYTAAVSKEGLDKIINLRQFNNETLKIAIVGACGIIGEALTKILAREKRNLILIDKNKEELTGLKKEIEKLKTKSNIFISNELKDISGTDIIITATSHPGALIKSEYLKKGAIIYDIAQPMNVSPELIKERPDIIKIDGAYVSIPEIRLNFDMGPPPNTTFACLVETIIEALEDEKRNFVGKINLEDIEKIQFLAKKYGFCHAPFSCFGKVISLEVLKKEKYD